MAAALKKLEVCTFENCEQTAWEDGLCNQHRIRAKGGRPKKGKKGCSSRYLNQEDRIKAGKAWLRQRAKDLGIEIKNGDKATAG